MDIKQLGYFIVIVDADYNLSKAAEIIHISQSALSQMIKNFEEKEKISLFERSHGRFDRLSPAGEKLYKHAKTITQYYDSMMTEIRSFNTEIKGEIRIGVPPYITSTVFSEVMSKLRRLHPDIKIIFIEMGGYHLRQKLLLDEVDIAIILRPTNLDPQSVEEILLIENELCAFMDENHALTSKPYLDWSDLDGTPLAIFDESFMIHHHLMDEFKKRKIAPDILIQSNYWDFILRSTFGTDIITILPGVTLDYFPAQHIRAVPFHEPIKWQVVMCRNKKKIYSKLIEFVFHTVIEYF